MGGHSSDNATGRTRETHCVVGAAGYGRNPITRMFTNSSYTDL